MTMQKTLPLSRIIQVGGKGAIKKMEIGGNAPISIQTMWKEGIRSVVKDSPLYRKHALDSILNRLNLLSSLGCDLVRFAVPDMESAQALCLIQKHSEMPLVADIHFDYKLALVCLEGSVVQDGVRYERWPRYTIGAGETITVRLTFDEVTMWDFDPLCYCGGVNDAFPGTSSSVYPADYPKGTP
ncbi:MAG: 4-hydroxy-3-methylbut-2-en-1-yl diphosphate synthase [Bacteroidetes bacterium ADurb.Bin408]|nr:MAG: 4-hydroxy-3-methylbut-2-en-1-yl diphosphate synthase [Bacteroidetes bacterium ADurb.Bin408]